jgi:hypothetical protein
MKNHAKTMGAGKLRSARGYGGGTLDTVTVKSPKAKQTGGGRSARGLVGGGRKGKKGGY